MEDDFPPAYIKEYPEVFDRFTFDHLFKRLLADGYDNEDAKDAILYNCALSLLVMQERLDNNYYMEITADSVIAPDLLELILEELVKRQFKNKSQKDNKV
jgi:hypothetical protein